ncbi:MAG: SAM-dependent methyltransferase [Myxococcales bacterium]|nr:SAM-dependent methyltransferase [Myxococcales bacterium]
MKITLPRVRQYLQSFELEKLFIEELGWDRHPGTLEVEVDSDSYPLQGIAQKRGVQVFVCSTGDVPSYKTRLKIEKQVTKSAYEHLLIFIDREKTLQIWQWVARHPGQPAAYREHAFHPARQSGDALIQKLNTITIPLDEEEALDLTGTVHKLRDAFDRDRVTKRFYEHFKREHAAFLDFISGIAEQGDKEWYASLMLNRLMFVYFIQKKGFLDGDPDYLQGRLRRVQALGGRGKFQSFYRFFLLSLFHEGFSKVPEHRELDHDLTDLLGNVPYLNGGLFELHALEEAHTQIDIPDEAFENLFAFFGQYEWHLDTRSLKDDREINPDVLGHIFEKYINQKQMGAYYTKEDVTEHIAKSAVLPYLFEEVEKRCAVAFHPDSELWRLLRDGSDRYIYPEMRKGVLDVNGAIIPLPEDIEAGVTDAGKREDWNEAAGALYALPTETWREHVARRRRCLNLRAKLAAGEIRRIDDLVTHNLDIRQFAQDVVENCEGPELLRSFYHVIAGRVARAEGEESTPGMSVLDPTCGSGAFLFAALHILQPIYESCLERMEAFVSESDVVAPRTPEEQIDELVARGESQTLEFKSTARWDVRENRANKALEKPIVKTVAAMLNTDGGDLLIGISDNGQGFGIEHDFKVLGSRFGNRDGYENWITTLVLGSVGKHSSACIDVSFATRDNKDVCRISISPSPTAVYIKDGEAEQLYIRAGNSSRLLSAREAVEYHKQRFEGQRPQGGGKRRSAAQTESKLKHQDFRDVLEEVSRHSNRAYFILKSIIVNNLYGLDIMAEAVEICKLRLFLKLVAQVDAVGNLEPLPDVDFNIRAGNTLVGYATLDELKDSVLSIGVLGVAKDELEQILGKAATIERGLRDFQQMQVDSSMDTRELAKRKEELRNGIGSLREDLDQLLGAEYGVDVQKRGTFDEWRESHAPFHWFAEFFGIMGRGGFDVIIGNPPYVEYRTVRDQYTVRGYETERCGDLYAMVLERCYALARVEGRLGLIVPISIFGVDGFSSLQGLTVRSLDRFWCSSFANRPSQLFDGAQKRLTILVGRRKASEAPEVFTSRYLRWNSAERQSLFPARLEFVARPKCFTVFSSSLEKLGSEVELSAFEKVAAAKEPLERFLVKGGKASVYYTRKFGYFLQFLDEVPKMIDIKTGKSRLPSELKSLRCASANDAQWTIAHLSSSTFFWFWNVLSDCRNLNRRDLLAFPVAAGSSEKSVARRIARLGLKYLKRLKATSRLMTKSGSRIETFDYKGCKSEVDKIDRILAEQYGLTEEEQDFVMNYDVKYRLGLSDRT